MTTPDVCCSLRHLHRARVLCAVLVLGSCLLRPAWAQPAPDVPEGYRRLFLQYNDQRPFYEKALNSIGLSAFPVGRSCALIAGASLYPNLPLADKTLRPADVDIAKLTSYLKDQEFFDEIVVLQNADMTLDNLDYFLQTYFPQRLKDSPHSRFLFAYSGHGYALGSEETATGYLLKNSATSLTDPVNRISLDVVRTLLEPDIESAEKVLVLINSCQSGSFGRRAFGGSSPSPLAPGERGAHAIMASKASQRSFQVGSVGPGSVFFEKIFAGLDGVADTNPRDGVVTYHELTAYLLGEIPYATGGTQKPVDRDISRNQSEGEFFFLNRRRQVQLGTVKEFNPGSTVAMGVQASDVLEQGRAALDAGDDDRAFLSFVQAAAAGNVDGMYFLGVMYYHGSGTPQDYQRARTWLEKAVAGGSAPAMTYLGQLQFYGHGVKQDYEQAVQWFGKAAAAGDPAGMSWLGNVYFQGRGVKQDFQQGRRWFEKAAALGDSFSMFFLGLMFSEGAGVKRDYQQARQWFEKAAAAGDSEAMLSLGVMCEKGMGMERDSQQARQWYQRAAAAGSASAAERLRKVKD